MPDFESQLNIAREKGQVAAKRRGKSVKALTLRQLDAGITEPVDIWRAVLKERGDLPEWLASASKHELAVILAAWGNVKHTIRQNAKGKP